MRIALLTTWNQACGISEHSRALTKELQKAGHTVEVLANIPYEKIVQEDEFFVVRCFEVEIRTNKKFCDYTLMSSIINNDCDILVVQYENLYNGYLDILFPLIKKPIVIEFHSSCIGHLPWNYVSASITHNTELRVPGKHIHLPMGIFDVPYVLNSSKKRIVSYGLGRNDDTMVKQAIERLKNVGIDATFETSYGHHGWRPMDDLIKFIQSGDVVSLIYPYVGASVSSSAVNLAFGCRRPVITSKTNWFNSVSDHVIQIQSVDELVQQLTKLFLDQDYYEQWASRKIVEERSWTKIVQQHLNLYQSLKK